MPDESAVDDAFRHAARATRYGGGPTPEERGAVARLASAQVDLDRATAAERIAKAEAKANADSAPRVELRPLSFDDRSANALRAATFDAMIGQDRLKRLMRRIVANVRASGRSLNHIMITGTSGTGFIGPVAPIIILTGQSDYEIDLQASALGVADFLVKQELNAATVERSIRYAISLQTARADLARSEERHRLLAENSTDLVARFALDATITYASPASCTLLGYQPEQLIGQMITDLMHPDDRAGQDERWDRVDATPEATLLEFRLRHRDGRWLWSEATVRAIRDERGVVIERQAAIRLIEDRKRLQVMLERQRDEATELLAEQSALGQISTLVAQGENPDVVFTSVAEQIAKLLGSLNGAVSRFDAATSRGTIVGGWSSCGLQLANLFYALDGVTASAAVFRTGRLARTDTGYGSSTDPIAVTLTKLGATAGIAAPITVAGNLWGALGASYGPGPIPTAAEARLERFASLVGLAISNADAWDRLERQASTDPLTGIANRRAFDERLSAEVSRAQRYERDLSLALIDLDHFKAVNDLHGHPAGDRVLVGFAQLLNAHSRAGELVARTGGEEFAWLMPETDHDAAHVAASRMREAVESTPFGDVGKVTISAGVCSNADAQTGDELLRFADQALYRAKQGGRNTSVTYTQDAPRTPHQRHPRPRTVSPEPEPR
jgi:diguanylate cyclase (GGDEF)-like protein/PAS domain S-box-containing protein